MKWWLILLAAGCTTKANSKYCDSTCSDPGTHCDTVKHECVAGAPDLGMADLSGAAVDDLKPPDDLIGADLTVVDLTPPPACTLSSMCPSSFPVCDPVALKCRACNGAGEDTICVQRSATEPHCKLSGTNMGLCAACNVSADCATATPVCNSDGTCRKCAANNECASRICDAPSGTCVVETDIIYVDASNDSGQSSCSETVKDGSKGAPFCEISKALMLLGLSTRHYVLLAPSDNNYVGFDLSDTMGRTITFIGPGKDVAKKATIQAMPNQNAINIKPMAAQTASVVLDGLTVVCNGNGNVLFCDSANSRPTLTVTNSSFANTNSGAVFINQCNFKMDRSYISGAGQDGLQLGNNSNYVVQNVFIWNNSTGVEFDTGNGNFSFNTVAYNMGSIGFYCGAQNTVIADSIVFGNKMNGNSQFNFGGGDSCTLINVVTGMDMINSSGKITAAPVFKSMTDLHLDTSAANLAANQACCIDQLNASSSPSPSPSPLPALDIDGSNRPKGARWDIGAHEAM